MEKVEESPPPLSSCSTLQNQQPNGSSLLPNKEGGAAEDEELRRLLLPDPLNLPLTPPSATDSNFVTYFAPDFLKPGHDQYIYRHANGLCVIGLAATHVALMEKGGVTAVDFNVGKSNRSENKVTGKRKRNAQHLEPNSALCKVFANENFYIVRCCVKGSLLEVNDRLIKQPGLLNSSMEIVENLSQVFYFYKHPRSNLLSKAFIISVENLSQADREGYIAIIMPKPADWLKIKNSLLSREDYKKLRGLC